MFTETYFAYRPNNDRYDQLLREAEHHRLVNQFHQSRPKAWRSTLFYVGNLLIGVGSWLQRHHSMPPVAQRNLIEV